MSVGDHLQTLSLHDALPITIPLGSLTADQEIVNGTRTFAPKAGARGVGAGGMAAAARPPAATPRTRTNSSVRAGRIFMMHLRLRQADSTVCAGTLRAGRGEVGIRPPQPFPLFAR